LTAISIDTETTGTDLYHGAKPFFVTTCDEEGNQQWWEWDVDPLTREPIIPYADIKELRLAFSFAGEFVFQNAKFDVTALNSIGRFDWPWNRTHDTIYSGHLLATSHPHDLTSMVSEYLGDNIEPYEKKLEEAVKECRQYCRLHLGVEPMVSPDGEVFGEPRWRIAAKNLPDMPSAKEKTWKYDSWLPRALAKHLNKPKDHYWWTVLSEYANADSFYTVELWKAHCQELRERKLWRIYDNSRRLLPIVHGMEKHGVTADGVEARKLRKLYREEGDRLGRLCVNLASEYGYFLQLPKSGNNKSLVDFIFNVMRLPPAGETESGKPSLDKSALDIYTDTLEKGGKPEVFIKSLRGKRGYDTACNYLDNYERYWLPNGTPGWYVLHPSVNPHDTKTLRFSFSHPNSANISKQEQANLRQMFGPMPGREWYSGDGENLELRIPAFEAGEEEAIDLFMHPERPPYFGSFHLLVFATFYPKLFAKHGIDCKTLFEATYYQWTKNFDFAVIYGCQEETGDRTAHLRGAFRMFRDRLPAIARLADRQIEFAEKHGYVETIPSKFVDPERGYPILCQRTHWGKVMPTTPLNYHVSGSAMQWMRSGMIKCQDQLDAWHDESGFDGRIAMQVHDELVFDFPAGKMSPVDEMNKKSKFRLGSNLWRVRALRDIMQTCGDDIGIPTPVALEWHPKNWAKGVKIK